MLKNYTPHTITLCGTDYPSIGIARVAMTEVDVGALDEILVIEEVPGEITGLPAPELGTYYVVSRMVAEACPDRRDLVFPARVQRDAQGRPSHCLALGRARGER